jgi:hypothetical protein
VATDLTVSVEIESRRRPYVLEVHELVRGLIVLPTSFRRCISLTPGSEEQKVIKAGPDL